MNRLCKMVFVILSLSSFGFVFGAVTEFHVTDVNGLTNALAALESPRVIYLAKGHYDVSGCTSEQIVPTYTKGLLTFRNGNTVTLSGEHGTKRGEVILDAKGTGRRMIYMNKGFLTITNLTFVGSKGGVLSIGNLDGKVTFRDSVFSNHSANAGAVMSRYYSTADAQCPDFFQNCLFVDCHATNGSAGAHCFRGGTAEDCFYIRCTSTASGGAVTSGNYIRCTFTECSTSTTETSQGGGAIGTDYDQHNGFCTDCEFIECRTTGAYGAHGAAIHDINALTNCLFKSCSSSVNGIIGDVDELVGCVFEKNSTQRLAEKTGIWLDSILFGNDCDTALCFSLERAVNLLVVSNHCAKTQGIFMNGQFVNATFIGNECTSGAASDSIINANCSALNTFFYENRAHHFVYNDIAMRFANDTLVTPFTPFLTNCVWSAEKTFNNLQREAAYARTLDCRWIEANDQLVSLNGFTRDTKGRMDRKEPFYTLGGDSPLRRTGAVNGEVMQIVGERDLAGHPRFQKMTVSLGCYEPEVRGCVILLR